MKNTMVTSAKKSSAETSWPALFGLIAAVLLIAGGAYYLDLSDPAQARAVPPVTPAAE